MDEDHREHWQISLTVDPDAELPEVQFKLTEGVRMPRDFVRNAAPWARIAGRVVDPQGNPISGVPVLIRLATPSPDGRRSPGTFSVPTTKDDGRYEVGAQATEAECVITLEVGPTTGAKSKPFIPRSGERTQVEDIVVERLPAVSEVSGMLVDPRGQPVTEASVSISEARSTQSDSDGGFHFDLYDAEKPVWVRVQANSFQDITFNHIPPGTRDAKFVLRPINPKLNWTDPPALPDPARIVGHGAPELSVNWIVSPKPGAQPPPDNLKRDDRRMTVLMFIGSCPTPDAYRKQLESLEQACADRATEVVVIFSPRFHESAIRGIVAAADLSIWAAHDRWPDDDSPITYPGLTQSRYGSYERPLSTIFVIDSDGVVRHQCDTFTSLSAFLKDAGGE